MIELPIQTVPDFSKFFIIETDASNKGLGVVYCKKVDQLFFMVKLCQIEHNPSQCTRELKAIVIVVQKWRHYLIGRHFIILTNQKNLKFQ